MKAKDVALLGFVSAAQEYVKKHMNDGSNLGDLQSIDISKLREKLFNQLKFFDGTNEEIKTLITAGEDAFKDYKEEKLTKTRINIVNLLGNTFKTKEDEEEKDLTITIADVKQELIELDNKQEQELNENVIQEQRIEEAQSAVEELTQANDLEDIGIDNSIETQDFGISDEDELFKAISNAASKSDEELAKLNKPSESINEVYADVVNNENVFKNKKEKEPTLSEVLKGYGNKEVSLNDDTASVQIPVSKYPEVKVNNPPLMTKNPGTLSESLKNISAVDTDSTIFVQEVADEINPLANSNPIDPTVPQYLQFIENPGVDAVDEDFYKNEAEEYETKNELQQLNAQYSEEPDYNNVQETYFQETNNESTYKALEALNNFVDKKEKKIEEEKPIVKEDDNKPIYDNIASIFPYLSYDFIKGVYADREEIANSYKEGEDVILLHRCIFKDIDNLHEFVEITISHNYQVNVDEKQMIVDVLKNFENEEGAILSNIYTIANQARVLNGEYEGYRVIV